MRLPLVPTEIFPVRLHVIMHPKEKSSRSSCAGLKFLCAEYYDVIIRGGSSTPRRFSRPGVNSSSGREVRAEDLPWITTSQFRREDPAEQEQGGRAIASSEWWTSTEDFVERVGAENCVLLYPAGDAVGVSEFVQRLQRAEKAPTKSLQEDATSAGAVAENVKNVSESEKPKPKVVILIDCTWFQTEEVFKHLPVLQTLSKVKIESHRTLFWRHHGRQQSGEQLSEEHLSTVEAAYWLVRETMCAGEGAEYDRRLDGMLFWFVQQWRKIQTVYASKGRDMLHKPGWVQAPPKVEEK